MDIQSLHEYMKITLAKWQCCAQHFGEDVALSIVWKITAFWRQHTGVRVVAGNTPGASRSYPRWGSS